MSKSSTIPAAATARLRCGAVHALRLTALATLVWLVHDGHGRFVARQVAFDLRGIPVGRVQRYLPSAAAYGGESPAVAGGLDIVDAAGDRVGTVQRTSPVGDAAIGFSGPTDLLVVADSQQRIAGVEVLSSRDTRDHVRAVERDPKFLRSFVGRPLAEIAAAPPGKADAVAGATLTSLAIAEALALRLGGRGTAGRFDTAPALADLRRLFPEANAIETDPGDPAVIRARAADGTPLGWALRTSPAADRVIGYQGPTDALVGFDAAGRVAGVAVLATYDNEPYVGYVRDDEAFRGVFRGMTFEELAGIVPSAHGIEGVSGATMTSQAVAEGIVVAARGRAERAPPPDFAARVAAAVRGVDGPQWGALAVIAAGVATAFTRLRGGWFGRLALPVVVVAYIGFGAGALLSQAQLWGWAQAGVPRGAAVLLVLTAVSFVLPAVTRRNVYCSHLCPHGAAQQLLVRFARPRGSIPPWLRPWLSPLPWLLFVFCMLTAILHLPVALVDLEPFDAYLPTVAGAATLVIFVVSLLGSAFVPMAYCRHACPTGALLDHVRFHGRAERITWRDGAVLGCLAIAIAERWWAA